MAVYAILKNVVEISASMAASTWFPLIPHYTRISLLCHDADANTNANAEADTAVLSGACFPLLLLGMCNLGFSLTGNY